MRLFLVQSFLWDFTPLHSRTVWAVGACLRGQGGRRAVRSPAPTRPHSSERQWAVGTRRQQETPGTGWDRGPWGDCAHLVRRGELALGARSASSGPFLPVQASLPLLFIPMLPGASEEGERALSPRAGSGHAGFCSQNREPTTGCPRCGPRGSGQPLRPGVEMSGDSVGQVCRGGCLVLSPRDTDLPARSRRRPF